MDGIHHDQKGIKWVRLVVPVDLVSVFRKKNLMESLATKDRHTANQGLLAALVADAAADELRGTAFGVFNFASGIPMLGASVLAGYLWQTSGPSATFLAGAGFTALGLIGTGASMRSSKHQRRRAVT
jgi:MFS family permease